MVDFSKYENQKWFKQLKESRKEYSDVKNIIESAKEKYNRENHVYEWVTGIGLGILLSLGLGNIIQNSLDWVVYMGYMGYIVAILSVIIGAYLYTLNNKRQEIAFIWLYRELDKQEKKKVKSKN